MRLCDKNQSLVLLLLLAVLVWESDARGGRRGGGSFGGIFGGWRKYKKPSSGGSGRRIINGSPMHSAGSVDSGISSSGSLKSSTLSKPQASYPRQQMPAGYQPLGYGAGAAPLPPGGTYYANTAAMPPGAIYYAQPPMRSSGSGDFLFGMMAGHVMSQGLFGHRAHVSHIYHQGLQPGDNSSGGKVIIVNNGEAATNASGTETETGKHFWPTDTDVPLEPFNASVTPQDVTNSENQSPGQSSAQDSHAQSAEQAAAAAAASPPSLSPPSAPSQPGSIICMPLFFNETDPADLTKTQHVEKIVCFPASALPPPPPLPPSAPMHTSCITRTVTEPDPNDSTQMVEKQLQDCSVATTEPPLVAGDIGSSVDNETPKETAQQL